MKFPEWLNVYGDQSFRGECPAETSEQVAFFAELKRKYPQLHARNTPTGVGTTILLDGHFS